jgi:hypothetical protein
MELERGRTAFAPFLTASYFQELTGNGAFTFHHLPITIYDLPFCRL